MPSRSWRPPCIVPMSEPPSFVRNIKATLKQSSRKVRYMPEAEQRHCGRKNREVRAHLTSARLEGELSFSLTLRHLGSSGRKECLLLPVFTSFLLNGLIGFPLHVQRGEREAKTCNCFRLFSLSSNTATGLGTAGSQPDF